ncbi:hypothetical protein BU17DRAFT_67279 [Hysterangium stoloniferum]|nr:hypothetical protein BU17DRAFT_67279 [Hysterangium stoloniferum]
MQEKMDEFTAWCLGHEQQKAQDWWWNKLGYPWYIPALCCHFSKIPSADWDVRPTNTNNKEQSHQATNCATSIHIPLAEAIDSAFEYDKQIAWELQLALENLDRADHIYKEVTNIEFKLAAALEEKKIAIENVNQL